MPLIRPPQDFYLPPNIILAYAGSVVPQGFLECNGAPVLRVVYDRLFAAIGTTFGAGDGATTFNLPNISRKIIAAGSVGAVLGAEEYTLTAQNLPAHGHFLSGVGNFTGGITENHYHSGSTSFAGDHVHGISPNDATGDGGTRRRMVGPGSDQTSGAAGSHGHVFNLGDASNQHGHSLPLQGGGAPFSLVNPCVVMMFLISF